MSGSNGKKSAPKVNGNGRTPNGTFAKGNPGGPGNPWAKMSHRLKSEIIKASKSMADGERTRLQALAEELWEMALGQPYEDDKSATAKRWAMQQLLDRIAGKPKEHVELDAKMTVTVADFFRQAAERARSLN